jgi:hypothetical protein
MIIHIRTLALVVLATGCGRGKTSLGSGPGDDGRLISTVYTWECLNPNDGALYQGVYGQEISLEFAPDDVQALDLPAAGDCEAGLDLFPADAGAGGVDIPGIEDEPRWTTDASSGELDPLGGGYYYDSVLENVHSCQEVGQLLKGGSVLSDAGVLDDIATPEPESMPSVTLDGDYESGIPWGTDLEASWDADHEWDDVWVQVRRERDGEAWESVTCNATGGSSFDIDGAIWSMMTESLSVDTNNLYVGFNRSTTRETDDGLKIEAVTRAIAVASVLSR